MVVDQISAGKDILRKVHAPTLLLVGGNDDEVLKLNENALKDIKAERKKTHNNSRCYTSV